MASFFKKLIKVIRNAIKQELNFSDMIKYLIGILPSILDAIEDIGKLKDKNVTVEEAEILIDTALEEFDKLTGEGALRVLKGIPVDKAEEALDNFKEFIRIIMYNKAKVKGYVE